MAAVMAAAPASDTQPATAGEPDQPQDDKKFSMLPVDLDALIDSVKCPICMGILRNTHAVSVCMHRFCKGCIEKWLRSQRINNCPQCRVEFASRRDLRQDPQFDTLLSILFCDLDAFEQAIAPSENTIERAKAIGQQLLKAQEERRQQQRALASLPRAKQQQQLEPAEAVAGAMVHVTVASGSKQPKQQQQHSRAASPSIPGGLKRSSSQATVQDAKRHRGDAVPELISPNGSKYRGVRAVNGRYQARFKVGGKEVSVGHFDTVQEAAQAYDLEQVRRHGSKAQLNLPHLRPQYKEQLAKDGSRPQSAGAASAAALPAQPAASRQQSLSTMAAAGMLAGVGRPRSAGMEEAAAALAEMDATEEEDVVDPVEAGRQRASQLAQQFPMRNAFSGVTPIAHIRLEAVGQLDWEVRHLSCPAATSVGQLKQAMVFGLSQQFGTAAFARPLVLAVQNDLDSSVNFDALFATSSEGSLLLREHVTVRELLGLLEECTEDLVLEYSC